MLANQSLIRNDNLINQNQWLTVKDFVVFALVNFDMFPSALVDLELAVEPCTEKEPKYDFC